MVVCVCVTVSCSVDTEVTVVPRQGQLHPDSTAG